MGLLAGLFMGFLFGFSVVAFLKYFIAVRSKQRLSKAWVLQLLGKLDQSGVKRLCENDYPSWLSFPTFEQVRWLNMQSKEIWPSFALAASKLIEVKVEPLLQAYCPPGFQMKFKKLFLGNVAPQIQGIKVHTSQKGMLIMDLDFKWGGDPSIILETQTPIGANLPVQLKDFKFFAMVRVIFKLSEDLPCFSGVAIALLGEPKPQIRYELKLLGGSVTGIPGISDVINDIVESAVLDTLQWPHRIVIPLGPSPVDLSDLELKLQGKLILKIIMAHSLKNQELIGKSDPYVTAYVRPLFKCKTKVVENSLDPVWNETFELNVEDKETQSLVLQVKDENIGANELVGAAVLPLSKLKDEVTTELTLDLAPSFAMVDRSYAKDCGSITVSVKYHCFTREEQASAMEKEKAEVEEKKAAGKAVLGSGTMDIIGGVVGGAGRLVADGASIMGSGIGKVSSSLESAGKLVSKSVSKSFATN